MNQSAAINDRFPFLDSLIAERDPCGSTAASAASSLRPNGAEQLYRTNRASACHSVYFPENRHDDLCCIYAGESWNRSGKNYCEQPLDAAISIWTVGMVVEMRDLLEYCADKKGEELT